MELGFKVCCADKAVAKQQALRSKASMDSVTRLKDGIITSSLAPPCV